MSKSKRDIRTYKARNAEKIFGEVTVDILFKKGIYPTKDTPKIAWSIQGKRRRNSTRKGNQKVKQMVHQIDRAQNKKETQHLIKEYYETFE